MNPDYLNRLLFCALLLSSRGKTTLRFVRVVQASIVGVGGFACVIDQDLGGWGAKREMNTLQ